MSVVEALGDYIDSTAPVRSEPESGVKETFTPRRRSKRPKRSVEALEFIGAVRRFLRAAGSRVATADEYELRALLELQNDLDQAIATAVAGQRSIGRSWAYIALATGASREAAYQRWGKK